MGFFREKRIYADAAAATPLHPQVEKRMRDLHALYGNPGALHKEGVAAHNELERARKEIAHAINAHPNEIIFTGSGTEANNLAILGSLYPVLRAGKARALTLSIEHPSVTEPLKHLRKYGLSTREVPVGEDGVLSLEALKEMLTPEVAFVSIQLVNSEVGTIEPVREAAKLIRHERKRREEQKETLPLVFHTDAAQAPLYLPLDVEKLGVDLMTLDAQKALGPKGVGLLYKRRGVFIEPIMFGGRQEGGLRPGTENAVHAGACAEALMLAKDGFEERAKQMAQVRDFLLEEIRRLIPEAEANGSLEHRIANNLNISIPGLEGETAVLALDAMGVAASTRSACDLSGADPSHVVLALGHSPKRAREAIRFTLLPDATRADVALVAQALLEACELYRKKP